MKLRRKKILKEYRFFFSLKKIRNRIKYANLMTFTLLTFIFIRPKRFRRGSIFLIKHLIFSFSCV